MKKTKISKAVLSFLLILTLCTGCAPASVITDPTAAVPTASPAPPPADASAEESPWHKFTRTDMSVFDTVISLIGFAKEQAEFDAIADEAVRRLREFDHIFDGYNEYEGLHNLYYVNRYAAQEPVEIREPLFDLLSWCQEQWEAGLRQTNVAMGAVLSIWHEYRDAGTKNPDAAQLPPMEDLQSASQHVSFDQVTLDEEKHTVFFSDPALTLDIGAVAKGYAADAIADYLYSVMPSFLLSLGGNVYAGQPPLDGRAAWAVGVQDPKHSTEVGSGGVLDVLDVHDKTVVTSGDYWRYYVVDGKRYHHIIDPETLMPSRKMLSVTILCDSSVLADFLSTALFVLSYEDGRKLADSLEGVEVMWVLPDGTVEATEGMADYARSLRGR